METAAKLGGMVLFATILLVAGWAMAQDSNEEVDEEESCEWKFVANHTSTDAKGHFWNECTGELYYVIGTSAERVNVNLD